MVESAGMMVQLVHRYNTTTHCMHRASSQQSFVGSQRESERETECVSATGGVDQPTSLDSFTVVFSINTACSACVDEVKNGWLFAELQCT